MYFIYVLVILLSISNRSILAIQLKMAKLMLEHDAGHAARGLPCNKNEGAVK